MTESIMVIGSGDLGRRVLYDLGHTDRHRRLMLLGRNEDIVVRTANLTRFSALQRGYRPEVSHAVLDLADLDQVAAAIDGFQPDVIFLAVSLQSWWVTSLLPAPAFQRISAANLGTWLPMHLAPTLLAMRAIRACGSTATVVNASYPDAVNPVLEQVGLGPDVGIGNVANNVPAFSFIASTRLGCPVEEISIRFIAHHYASQQLRHGSTGGAEVHLEVLRNGVAVEEAFSIEDFGAAISGQLRRTGGKAGQAMISASALNVIEPLLDGSYRRTHAPGVHGLAGGYPIVIDGGKISLDLPTGIDVNEAVRINHTGQVLDGVSRIHSDGTVDFSPTPMGVLTEELGYDCRRMRLDEVFDRADELAGRYRAYQKALSGERADLIRL